MASEQDTKGATATASAPTTTTASSDAIQRRREASADPAAATPAASSTWEMKRHELHFEALQNAEYHSIREGFLLTAHRIFMALTVVSGTAAFAAVLQDIGGEWRAWVALGPVVFSVLDLVFNLTGRANQHSTLRGRFQSLTADIEVAEADRLPALRDEMRAIYPTEPPPYPATQALGYNAAVDRIYEEPEAAKYRLHVPARDRILGQMLRIKLTDYHAA